MTLLKRQHDGHLLVVSDSPGQIPFRFEQLDIRVNPRESLEMRALHHQPILSILMRVHSSIQGRPTPTTRSRTGKGEVESGSLGSEFVKIWGIDRFATVATEVLAEVIGDHEQYILST